MISLRSLLVCITFLAAAQPYLLYASVCTPTVSSGESIQDAIDAASSGDTICVGVGTYTENLTLKDGVILKGEELAGTIIDGGGSGAVITGSSLTLGGIYNITITGGETGLSISSVTGLTVSNVIIVGNGYGISSDGSTSVTITNTVIDQNTSTGITLANSSSITIQNSILSNNIVDISGDDTSSYTGYYNLIYNNTTTYYYYDEETATYTDDTSIYAEDPLFVDSSSNDFHLQSDSPAIDTGFGTDIIDDTQADIGVYGGANMDTAPFPVYDLSATASSTDANALDLTWSANNAYNIAGYKVYFDSDASGAPDYDPTSYDGSSTEGASPIDVGDATSFTLPGLTATATAPESPTGLMTAPGNTTISVSWDAVDEATGYIVYWGTSSGSYAQSTDVGDTTSYTIQGLTNGTVYYIAVSAYNAPTYYVAVTAYDSSSNESAVVSEISVPMSNTAEGLKSNETPEYPEESVPFPNLKDEGLCFIATAAYGSNMEPDVVILRKFRNHYLLTNPIGRGFTAFYYRYSPPMADFIRDNEILKSITRMALFPFVLMAKLLLSTTLAFRLLIFMLAALLTASLLPAMRRKLS